VLGLRLWSEAAYWGLDARKASAVIRNTYQKVRAGEFHGLMRNDYTLGYGFGSIRPGAWSWGSRGS
jgi:hypothetical protein